MKSIRLNISQKFIGYLILLSVLPLFAVGITSYQTSSTIITTEATRFVGELVQNQRNYLALQLSQVESLITNIAGVEEIRSVVEDASLATDTYTDLTTQAQIGYILNSYSNLEGLVSIDIFTVNDAHYHVGDTLNTDNIRTDLRDSLFNEALSDPQPIIWFGVEDNINVNSTYQKVITAAKVLYTINRETLQQEPTALILINYSVEFLYDNLSDVDLGEDAYFVIIDDKQRLIYHPDFTLLGTEISTELQSILLTEAESSTASLDNIDVAVSRTTFDNAEWIMAGLIPVDTLVSKADSIRSAVVVVLLLCFVAVAFIGWFYNRSVVTPIRRITEQFQRMQASDDIVQQRQYVEVTGNDDISELSHWFNSFVDILGVKQQTEEALRESLEITQTLYQSSQTFIDEKNVDNLLQKVVETLQDSLDANKIILQLLDEKNQPLVYSASADNLEETDLNVIQTNKFKKVTALVMQSGQAIGLTTSSVMHQNIDDPEIILNHLELNQIFLPLQYRAEILGIVYALKSPAQPCFTNQDIELMIAVVNQAAIAIENARLIQSLQESEEKFFKAFHSNPDPMTISTLDTWEYVDINDSFLTVTKYERDEVVQHSEHSLNVWSKQDRINFIDILKDKQSVHDYETTLHDRSGKASSVVLLSAEVIELNGRHCFLTVSKDITERKQVEQQQLQLAVERKRMEVLSGFITEASHEFKTPLAIINTNAYLLRQIISDEKSGKKLDKIEEQVYTITSLVESLTLMTTLDSGGHDLRMSRIGINQVVKDICAEQQPHLDTKKIDHKLNLTKEELYISGDINYLQIALKYIMQNAIQYSDDDGTITVNIKKDGRNVIIEVIDTGIGIHGEELQHIFERFYQSDKAGTMRGFGLGLPIANTIIDLHHGHIHVESVLGEGSIFRTTLPLFDKD